MKKERSYRNVCSRQKKRVAREHWQCERKRKTDRERARELEMKENTMWLAICFSHWILYWPRICFWNPPFLLMLLKNNDILNILFYSKECDSHLLILILKQTVWQDLACTYIHNLFHMRPKRIRLKHRAMFIWPNAFHFVYFNNGYTTYQHSTWIWCLSRVFWTVHSDQNLNHVVPWIRSWIYASGFILFYSRHVSWIIMRGNAWMVLCVWPYVWLLTLLQINAWWWMCVREVGLLALCHWACYENYSWTAFSKRNLSGTVQFKFWINKQNGMLNAGNFPHLYGVWFMYTLFWKNMPYVDDNLIKDKIMKCALLY